ncbi:MAG: ankyrin repeat domain-containing protein [Rickettsiales bacterium]|jgi:ankyrin repeat protein|nr:ankyrin repeat domain-containing protein [Rickettsiales bacterium]
MVTFPSSMSETMIRGDGMKIRNMISLYNLDVHQQDEKENTLLHYAVLSGNEDTVRTILKLNPNPKIQNKEGKTPLQLAKKRGFILPEDITFQLTPPP